MNSSPIIRTVTFGSQTLSYTLTRKNVKNLNLRVKPDGQVAVSAPARVPLKTVDAFVLSSAAKIIAAQERFRTLPKRENPAERTYADGDTFPLLGEIVVVAVVQSQEETDRASFDGHTLTLILREPDSPEKRHRCVESFLMPLRREVYGAILDEAAPAFAEFGVEKPDWRIRDMSSRWGSCIPKKKVITLNARLIAYPRETVRSVIVHEMCHFLEPSHSPRFYAWMTKFYPDWKKAQEVLR